MVTDVELGTPSGLDGIGRPSEVASLNNPTGALICDQELRAHASILENRVMAGGSKLPAVVEVARAEIVVAPPKLHCLVISRCEEECVARNRVSGGTAEAVRVGESETLTPASVLVIENVFVDDVIGATGIQTKSTTKVVRANAELSSSADREDNAVLVGYFISVTTDTPVLPCCGVAL